MPLLFTGLPILTLLAPFRDWRDRVPENRGALSAIRLAPISTVRVSALRAFGSAGGAFPGLRPSLSSFGPLGLPDRTPAASFESDAAIFRPSRDAWGESRDAWTDASRVGGSPGLTGIGPGSPGMDGWTPGANAGLPGLSPGGPVRFQGLLEWVQGSFLGFGGSSFWVQTSLGWVQAWLGWRDGGRREFRGDEPSARDDGVGDSAGCNREMEK